MSLMGHNERGARAGQRFCRCALAAVVLAKMCCLRLMVEGDTERWLQTAEANSVPREFECNDFSITWNSPGP